MLAKVGLRFWGVALLACACGAPIRVDEGQSSSNPTAPSKTAALHRTAAAPSNPADPSAVGGADWWSAVEHKLIASEHRFRNDPQGFEAGNREHNLRAHFFKGRVAFATRSDAKIEGPTVRSTSFGRVGQMTPLSDPVPELGQCDTTGRFDEHDNCVRRLEYKRDANLVEWWENTNSGMEQGWSVAQKPAGDGPFSLTVAVSGANLKVRPDAALMTSKGIALRCEKPTATDSAGQQLPARIDQTADGFSIVVDDQSARYPIRIDPVYTTWDWTAESNQANANFGYSVAGAGDVNNDGYSDVIVGAYAFDDVDTDKGAAFLYLGSDLGLSDTAAWSVEGTQASANFGYSVAAAGDVNNDGYDDVIIGAYQYDDSLINQGAAFIYDGSASGLAGAPSWTGEINQTGANFGSSVAGAGDVNNDGYADVIVGAYNYSSAHTNEGGAFIFLGSGTGAAITPAWTALGGQDAANFGRAVAGAGDVNNDGYDDVIVGADHYESIISQADEGRAYVFLGSGTGVATNPIWTAESNLASARFGAAVASAGDINGDGYADVLVGAPNYTNGASKTNEGRAYLYLGSSSGPAGTAAWTVESGVNGATYGTSVSGVHDVNADGYDDFIIGAPLLGNGQATEGRAYLYLGSAAGVQATVWTTESDQAGATLGSSVAGAGDVNGDGYSDILIGAAQFTMGQSKEGRAFLYLGSEAGMGGHLGIWTTDSGNG
ncbi:MAG TPA: FG-GAP-like repeat-containing protein, partial [Polyangiaceae bacterium]|nr:FG-GAP-like repeat-containing protein [Polyangiaceae bacterium]